MSQQAIRKLDLEASQVVSHSFTPNVSKSEEPKAVGQASCLGALDTRVRIFTYQYHKEVCRSTRAV